MPIQLIPFALFILIQLFAGSTVGARKAGRKDVLNGYHLRASAYHFPPLFSIIRKPGGNYSYEGYAFSATEELAKILNMTVDFVNVDPLESKTYDINECFRRQFLRKEIDFVAYAFEITFDTLEYVALSYPSHIAEFTLLQPWPKEQSRLTGTIRPFTLGVWLWFIGATIAFIAIMSALAAKMMNDTGRTIFFRDATRSKSWWELIYAQLEYVLTIITSQGNFLRYSTSVWIRAGVAFWLLAMIVLINAYTGVLTAILTVPLFEPTIKTLEELALTKRYRLTMTKDLLMAKQIMNSTEGYNTVFRDYFLDDPSLFTSDSARILDNVLNHGCAYAGPTEITNFYINQDLKLHNKCRMTVPVRPLNHFVSWQNGFSKDFPYVDVIVESVLIPAMDFGFLRNVMKLFGPLNGNCRADSPPESKIKVISVSDLYPPFFILIMGLCLSSIVFILENILNFLHVKYK